MFDLRSIFRVKGVSPGDFAAMQAGLELVWKRQDELKTQINRVERRQYRAQDDGNGADTIEKAFEPSTEPSSFNLDNLKAGEQVPGNVQL